MDNNKEKIGRCAWCGLVDHHLIDETGSCCREKVQTLNFKENLKEYGNVPLGVEAANVKEVYREHH